MKPLIILMLLISGSIQAQDSLSLVHLKNLSAYFNIKDGKMQGPGADSLRQYIAESQFAMIGEYHGSKRISEFTDAIIPICDQEGYKTMALEVGPVSGQVLSELSSPAEKTIANLYEFNSKWLYPEDEFTAIPFFNFLEDAIFLKNASARGWNLIGLDQEFYYSYEMLLDRMFNNLPLSVQQKIENRHIKIRALVAEMTRVDDAGGEGLAVAAVKSEELKSYLSDLSEFEGNNEIVDAFRKSIEIYLLHATRQWYENNETRIKYMKENMRRGVRELGLDIARDKVLLKMGGYHLSKGRSPLGFFEVGNMMNEIAEYNGSTTVNIAFTERYYMEDGEEKDMLTTKANNAYNVFAELGKKDEWVFIDLKKMRKGIYYYPIKYKVDKKVEELISRYDILIILPLETPPTRHF